MMHQIGFRADKSANAAGPLSEESVHWIARWLRQVRSVSRAAIVRPHPGGMRVWARAAVKAG